MQYHDSEWGVPLADDNKLFEMLVLETMQAGLSWLTVLKKRQSFIEAFDGFDPAIVAHYNSSKINELLNNAAIIRNKMKIAAAVKNGKAVLRLQDQYGSFANYIWQFVGFRPLQNSFAKIGDVPAKTALSTAISKDMKKKDMHFVGPTVVYAFMQAIGMVNDHEISCFRYKECARRAAEFSQDRM